MAEAGSDVCTLGVGKGRGRPVRLAIMSPVVLGQLPCVEVGGVFCMPAPNTPCRSLAPQTRAGARVRASACTSPASRARARLRRCGTSCALRARRWSRGTFPPFASWRSTGCACRRRSMPTARCSRCGGGGTGSGGAARARRGPALLEGMMEHEAGEPIAARAPSLPFSIAALRSGPHGGQAGPRRRRGGAGGHVQRGKERATAAHHLAAR